MNPSFSNLPKISERRSTYIQSTQPIQLIQPFVYYMAVPVNQLPRGRSSTEPYLIQQQEHNGSQSIPYQYYVEPIQSNWFHYQ